MRATFILTRFFAISAFVCGAAQLSSAAPIGAPDAPAVLVTGVDPIAPSAQEGPVVPRLDGVDLALREALPEAAPERPPDGEIQDIEDRTCFNISLCR